MNGHPTQMNYGHSCLLMRAEGPSTSGNSRYGLSAFGRAIAPQPPYLPLQRRCRAALDRVAPVRTGMDWNRAVEYQLSLRAERVPGLFC